MVECGTGLVKSQQQRSVGRSLIGIISKRIRWTLTYQELSKICCCSMSTVEHWFSEGAGKRASAATYQKLLAIADFLLTHSDFIQYLWQE